MSVKVAEAIGDEKGGSRGGEPGDQTGNEILIRTFKKRSYEFTECLRCTDRGMAYEAASYAKRIAECSQFGYNQSDRWSGPKAIEKVGGERLEFAEKGDFDCSSFVIEAYRLAGLNVKMTGYTGSIYKILKGTGLFVDADKVLEDAEYAEVGDVLNAPGKHVLMFITDGSKAEPEPEPEPIGSYVEIIRGKVNVRKTPEIRSGNVLMIARQGDTFPYLDHDERDQSGKIWWEVECEGRVAYISSENPRHAILVEA